MNYKSIKKNKMKKKMNKKINKINKQKGNS